MRNAKAWLFTVAMATAALAQVPDASACGGCFIAQSENTVVTGHRMILSISQQQTTLYDQFGYSGDPSSFAWILPVKGIADIGLSSDALFEALEQETTVTISSPNISCNNGCSNGFSDSAGSGGAGGAGGGGVTVVAQSTVGPYETVQLKSTDPSALNDWLAQHNYAIPADVVPVISAYVAEGFDFLALKLVPGKGVSAMRPVRVSTPGASPVLPLRMVAAGTGAITPITLWIMGEGRYAPSNMPSFQIQQSQLFWNWNTQSSNYALTKQLAFASTGNEGWLIEAGEPYSKWYLQDSLDYLAAYEPENSGYGGDGADPEQEVAEDLEALFGNIPDTSLWVTRLHGELSRPALAADLQLAASPDQTQVQRYFELSTTVGTPPACPPSPCGDFSGGFGSWGGLSGGGSSAGGCAMTSGGSVPMLGGVALVAALAFARRRRARR